MKISSDIKKKNNRKKLPPGALYYIIQESTAIKQEKMRGKWPGIPEK